MPCGYFASATTDWPAPASRCCDGVFSATAAWPRSEAGPDRRDHADGPLVARSLTARWWLSDGAAPVIARSPDGPLPAIRNAVIVVRTSERRPDEQQRNAQPIAIGTRLLPAAISSGNGRIVWRFCSKRCVERVPRFARRKMALLGSGAKSGRKSAWIQTS